MNTSNTFPALKILSGKHKGKRFRLIHQQIIIGSDNSCDVIFKGNGLSKRHARLKKAQGVFFLENLDPKNPSLVNKKRLSQSHILKEGDMIQMGQVKLQYSENLKPAALPSSKPTPIPKSTKKNSNLPRVILIIVLLGGASLFLLNDPSEESLEKKALLIKKEADILEDVKALEEQTEKEAKKGELSETQRNARNAFIRGFRDYNKGYYGRARKLFRHCLSLDKDNKLCVRYSGKARTQMDAIIQKNMRLGKAYKENKQYEACQAAFKSVEIVISDVKSPIYQEATANKEACKQKLRHTI